MRTIIWLVRIASTLCVLCARPAVGQKAPPRLPTFYRLPDGNYVLAEPFRFTVDAKLEIVVPAGFVTDFASIPMPAALLLPKNTLHDIPALVHDYLYWRQDVPKRRADEIFVNALRNMGIPEWQAWGMHQAVRSAKGDEAWKENCENRRRRYPRIIPSEYLNFRLDTRWQALRENLHRKNVKLDENGMPIPTRCVVI